MNNAYPAVARLSSMRGVFALLVVLVIPAVQGHGVAPDETFRLVLADDDGLIGYGGCAQGQCAPSPEPRAHDAVALEAREIANSTGVPELILRFLVEPVGDDVTRGIELTGMASMPFRLRVSVTGLEVESSLGRGEPAYAAGNLTAIEVTVPYDALGVKQGDVLTGIRFNTTLDDQVGDVVPGGWYDGDTMVPHVPHDVGELTEVAEAPALGQLTLLGPAPLLKIDVPFPQHVDGAWIVSVNVTNQLGEAHQEVTVTAAGQVAAVMVPATAARTVQLSIPEGIYNVTVSVFSDVGGYEEETLQLPAIPARESPAAFAVGALLAALALARRR